MGKRRKSRELALQALYQYYISDADIEEIIKFGWDKGKTDSEIKDFATILVKGTIKKTDELDEYIKNLSKNWDFSRINLIDKIILRYSSYSFKYQKDIPARVIINEAIDIAKKYSGDDSYKFINGILDEINKKVRKT